MADYIQKTLSRNRQLKEKQLINRLLRSGIENERAQPAALFKIKSFRTCLLPKVAAEDIEALLDEI